MPNYSTQCKECHRSGDVRMSFSDYDLITAGTNELACNQCDGKCEILFDGSGVQFSLRDGESGSWASKALRENAYRAKRRLYMAKKEADHVFKPKLQPNYNGVETGDWRAAQELARTETTKDFGHKGLGDLAASTYTPLIRKAK